MIKIINEGGSYTQIMIDDVNVGSKMLAQSVNMSITPEGSQATIKVLCPVFNMTFENENVNFEFDTSIIADAIDYINEENSEAAKNILTLYMGLAEKWDVHKKGVINEQ